MHRECFMCFMSLKFIVCFSFFFLWHFKRSLSFQWISNLFADKNRIWRKVVISSSFIQKYFAQRDLHASERKYRKIYHVKATYFSNWVNIFGNRQGELWQLTLDEHIRSLAILAISQIYQTISDSRESQLMFFYH